MLTGEELRMLAWITETSLQEGAILDLGCFLGGSSVALAHGQTKSALKRLVLSFDMFNIDAKRKKAYLYSRGYPPFEGTDCFPTFISLIKKYSDVIIPRQGDICSYQWSGNKISILFVDLAKKKSINDHLITTFFPCLMPGSVVIQQDFLLYLNPWLYPTMYKLRSCIDLLSHTEYNSVVFGVRSTPTREDIERCLSVNTTHDETLEAIAFYRSKFTGLRQLEMIDALLASVTAAPDVGESWNIPNVANIVNRQKGGDD